MFALTIQHGALPIYLSIYSRLNHNTPSPECRGRKWVRAAWTQRLRGFARRQRARQRSFACFTAGISAVTNVPASSTAGKWGIDLQADVVAFLMAGHHVVKGIGRQTVEQVD